MLINESWHNCQSYNLWCVQNHLINLLVFNGNNIGFQFKDGKITAIVKDSSAARNGLLTEHNLLEIEGINVVARVFVQGDGSLEWTIANHQRNVVDR